MSWLFSIYMLAKLKAQVMCLLLDLTELFLVFGIFFFLKKW